MTMLLDALGTTAASSSGHPFHAGRAVIDRLAASDGSLPLDVLRQDVESRILAAVSSEIQNAGGFIHYFDSKLSEMSGVGVVVVADGIVTIGPEPLMVPADDGSGKRVGYLPGTQQRVNEIAQLDSLIQSARNGKKPFDCLPPSSNHPEAVALLGQHYRKHDLPAKTIAIADRTGYLIDGRLSLSAADWAFGHEKGWKTRREGLIQTKPWSPAEGVAEANVMNHGRLRLQSKVTLKAYENALQKHGIDLGQLLLLFGYSVEQEAVPAKPSVKPAPVKPSVKSAPVKPILTDAVPIKPVPVRPVPVKRVLTDPDRMDMVELESGLKISRDGAWVTMATLLRPIGTGMDKRAFDNKRFQLQKRWKKEYEAPSVATVLNRSPMVVIRVDDVLPVLEKRSKGENTLWSAWLSSDEAEKVLPNLRSARTDLSNLLAANENPEQLILP